MAQAIIFDPQSAPIQNMVRAYKRSIQPADFTGRQDVLIYDTQGDPPNLRALIEAGIPMSRWKVVAGSVVELTAQDDQILADYEAARQAQLAADRLAELKQTALNYYNADQDALQKSLRAAIETVLELTVVQLNLLRAQHGLAALTAAQVKAAFYATYQDKINAIT